jgi:hypothetical protein
MSKKEAYIFIMKQLNYSDEIEEEFKNSTLKPLDEKVF